MLAVLAAYKDEGQSQQATPNVLRAMGDFPRIQKTAESKV